ncbi:transketolase subunit B [Chthonomonas calidirosea]|uniref:Transketolase subunit B n=1 Tax=Chthonomonas calidirosea (strain DSM 23976 / ICMP 18418 / T49) TaxID=1303518 RepID=S0EUU5_CHTCT|nr:transketolase C-terminal domain-containing protein [Chthonomonas calidirosea]CCW35482.1 transketolase subunit B [Chthonomonas calidirosea T49]CEK20139.1 transketolase subunit B [Chthonomonas calidirosea]
MRTAFIEELCKLAEEEERIWLLCGDLGYSVLERFRDRFPNRYVNVGVAEQNMTGMAAGLALCGKIVFTYSIANFPVMRCLEQIRNDICYHHANVKIVAVGGGLAYGAQGYTHHGVEDLAVMRVLPEMTVIAPGDPVETRLATRAIVSYNGPCYLRLGKAGEPIVHQTDPKFEIGKAILMQDGSSVTLISTGGMLATVMQAAQRLAENGIAARVLSMHTLAPLDREAILAAAAETGGIVTVEEHGIGGLASAVAEVLAVAGYAVPFRALHLPRKPTSHAGTQESLRSVHGLSVEGIVTVARALT